MKTETIRTFEQIAVLAAGVAMFFGGVELGGVGVDAVDPGGAVIACRIAAGILIFMGIVAALAAALAILAGDE